MEAAIKLTNRSINSRRRERKSKGTEAGWRRARRGGPSLPPRRTSVFHALTVLLIVMYRLGLLALLSGHVVGPLPLVNFRRRSSIDVRS